jgi:succinoglycan biosynthesis transport protein ExoP
MRETFDNCRQVLGRQRKVVLGVTGACLLLAVIYLLTATRLYRATARITADSVGTHQSGAPADMSPSGNFLRTQAERIASRSILALALSNPDVKDLKTFANVPNRLNAIRDGLTIDIGRLNDVISVSFDTRYPEEAPIIANAIVDAFKRYQTEPAHSGSADVAAVYQAQDDKYHQELDATTAKMTAMEQQYGVLSSPTDASDSISMKRLATLTQALTTAQLDTLKAKSEFEAASRSLPKQLPDAQISGKATSPRPVVVSADQEVLLQSQLIELQARQEAMRQLYLPNHPALQEMAQQIDQVSREYAGAVEQRWLLDQNREQELQTQVDAQQKQIVLLSAKTAEYQRLGGDVDHLRKLIDNLESRMQAIEATREADAVDVEILDPAEATVQSHPRPFAALSAGLLLGLALGVGAGLYREWADDGMRTISDVRAATGLSVLGSVPQMPWVMNLSVAAQKVAVDPSSEVADAYRAIRSAIQSSAPRDRCRTILITSPDVGDGKTTSAANVAIALAQSGKRILLVDAVLRDPMLHSIFSVSPNTGFGDLLDHRISVPEKTIRKTSVNGLWVLPAGLTPSSPSELLNSPALTELLDQLADKYDHVIIDAPPLAELPDARILAACCDLTVLVLRADTATRQQSIGARDSLLGVGAHILGLILARAPRETEEPVKVRTATERKQHLLSDHSDEDVVDVGANPS